MSADEWFVMVDEIEEIAVKYGLQVGVASKIDDNTAAVELTYQEIIALCEDYIAGNSTART